MTINKALIVAEPWIDLLLSGRKVWEMRSQKTYHRGWFGLIRKGSGKVVGVARLVDVGDTLSQQEMLATIDKHKIPEGMIRNGQVSGWSIPWKLADVRPLAHAVSYQHKSGAVTWVNLDEHVTELIKAQIVGPMSGPTEDHRETIKVDVRQRGSKPHIDVEWDDRAPSPISDRLPTPTSIAQACPSNLEAGTAATKTASGVIGEVSLTDGNIRNGHIYLRQFFDRFPADAIGGSNKQSAARRTVTVETSLGDTFETDLDGSKKFFRARGPIRAFLDGSRARPGDVVLVEHSASYRYRLSLKR